MSAPQSDKAANGPQAVRRENKLGQGIRPKGAATERNLMQATLTLLQTQSPVDVSVHAIAREARISPASFYVYFKSVKEVILALVDTLPAPYLRQVLPMLTGTWQGSSEIHVRKFVLAYAAFWDEHRRLLAVRNLEADLGDPDFVNRRIDMSLPVIEALADRVRNGSSSTDMTRAQAWAQAVVCCAALEEMFSYPPEAYRSDVPATPEDVIEAQITVIAGLLR